MVAAYIKFCVVKNSSTVYYNNRDIQVAALATLALLLAAIGGSDMSLQYMHFCTNQKYTNYGLSEW